MKYRRKAPAQACRVTVENVADPIGHCPAWVTRLMRLDGDKPALEAWPSRKAFSAAPRHGVTLWGELGDWILLEDGELKVMRHRDFNRIFGEVEA